MAAKLSSVAQMTFSGLFGGRETVAFSLTKLVKERISGSVLYLILETRSDEAGIRDLLLKLDGYDIPYRIFTIQSRFSWKLVRELTESLQNDQIQLVHCHCYKSVFYSLLARHCGKLKTKIAFTLHGLVTAISLNTMVLHLINLVSIATADSVIGCCNERVRLFKKLPFLRKRTFVIQNGFLKTLQTFPVDTKGSVGSSSNGTVKIGLVGRLSGEKNIPLFLNSIAKIYHHSLLNTRLHCTIAGEGELKDDLMQLASRLGIRDIVDFPGFVSDTDRLYASLDILALTSDYEGTPMCLLEGMSHRLPIIASAVGGITDLLEHNQTALLFRKGDSDGFTACMLDLIGNTQKRQSLGNAAYVSLSTKFSAETWCDKHIEHYRLLLGETSHDH